MPLGCGQRPRLRRGEGPHRLQPVRAGQRDRGGEGGAPAPHRHQVRHCGRPQGEVPPGKPSGDMEVSAGNYRVSLISCQIG